MSHISVLKASWDGILTKIPTFLTFVTLPDNSDLGRSLFKGQSSQLDSLCIVLMQFVFGPTVRTYALFFRNHMFGGIEKPINLAHLKT